MINAAIEATLPLMRAHAESLHTDTCKVDRENGTVWDEEAQESVPNWATIHASIACHFEQESVSSRDTMTDELVTRTTPTVKAAWTVAGVEPDDRITYLTVGPHSDPALVGAVLWVTHVPLDTHPVERIIECRWSR